MPHFHLTSAFPFEKVKLFGIQMFSYKLGQKVVRVLDSST